MTGRKLRFVDKRSARLDALIVSWVGHGDSVPAYVPEAIFRDILEKVRVKRAPPAGRAAQHAPRIVRVSSRDSSTSHGSCCASINALSARIDERDLVDEFLRLACLTYDGSTARAAGSRHASCCPSIPNSTTPPGPRAIALRGPPADR
jgi:hypothetical protein